MSTTLGSIRRLVLTPALADVTFAKRRFPVTPTAATERLEAIPQAVVCGFEWGIDSRSLWEVERRLGMIEPELRGFAYEGATMALTVRDATGGGHRTRDLLLGPGAPHIFLAYIGIGFAMARLPRPLWRKVLPDLGDAPFHPTMSWLAVDGFGFDRAYFKTRDWVDGRRAARPYPWLGAPRYFPRAADQGVGRALWFVHGGRVGQVAAAVRRFAADRQADLWSGVGLAATFAGGCEPADLAALRTAAGAHAPELGLGAVFATKARDYAGFVPDHTAAATTALTGLTVAAATSLADRTEVPADQPGPLPPYEQWRRRIHDRLADPAGCPG